VLAYVFWHAPSPGGDAAAYEEALTRFHRALGEAVPADFLDSSSHAVSDAPWMRGPGYEDWYRVADWAALGALNDAAVDARRRAPHDQVAAGAAAGSGAVYLLRAGRPSQDVTEQALWLEKPGGVPYQSFRERLERLVAGGVGGIWERQLVLGPAPEYCVMTGDGAAAAPAAATIVQRRALSSV
jgi:hypothetical protein